MAWHLELTRLLVLLSRAYITDPKYHSENVIVSTSTIQQSQLTSLGRNSQNVVKFGQF